MAKVEVTYLCWGCNSSTTKVEEVDSRLPLPAVEQWNICPECLEKKKKVAALEHRHSFAK